MDVPESDTGVEAAVSAESPPRRARPPQELGLEADRGLCDLVVIVVAIFTWAIPKFADYHDVCSAIKTLTPLESLSLVGSDDLQPRDLLVGEPGGPAGPRHRQSRCPDADHDVGREHAAGGGRDRDRSDLLDPRFVGVHGHERCPVRRRHGDLEHLHQARASGAGARVPRIERAPDPRVPDGRDHRRGRSSASRSACSRWCSAARPSRSGSATGSAGSVAVPAGCFRSRRSRGGADGAARFRRDTIALVDTGGSG